MYYLISGVGVPQPEIESIEFEKGLFSPDAFTTLKIKFKNLCGNLKSNGVPFGFTFRRLNSSQKPTIQDMTRIKIIKNTVCISIEKNIEELKEYEFFYGFGHDFYCNITDGADRAIPAMGPIKIKDYMEKERI